MAKLVWPGPQVLAEFEATSHFVTFYQIGCSLRAAARTSRLGKVVLTSFAAKTCDLPRATAKVMAQTLSAGFF